MATTTEGKVKKKLRQMFARYEPELYYFMPVQTGYGAPGLDFHCVFRGWAFFVETKAPGKKLTPRQKFTAAAMERAGGKIFVVSDEFDIDRVENALCTRILTEPTE